MEHQDQERHEHEGQEEGSAKDAHSEARYFQICFTACFIAVTGNLTTSSEDQAAMPEPDEPAPQTTPMLRRSMSPRQWSANVSFES